MSFMFEAKMLVFLQNAFIAGIAETIFLVPISSRTLTSSQGVCVVILYSPEEERKSTP